MLNKSDCGGKSFKKPVPLPRKSLLKTSDSSIKIFENDVKENTLEKISESIDVKSVPENFATGKKKNKNEGNKLEKSVKNLISRRKSSHVKSNHSFVDSTKYRSESLPDESVFFNISFNSPLSVEDDYCNNNDEEIVNLSQSVQNVSDDEEDDLLDFKSLSPPAYPPPELPDESLYDQMKNFNVYPSDSEESISNKSTCKYSKSNNSDSFEYEEKDNIETDDNELSKKVSAIFYDSNLKDKPSNPHQIIYESVDLNHSKNRYLYLNPLPVIDQNDSVVLEEKTITEKIVTENNSNQSQKNVIDMFDPLQTNKDLMTAESCENILLPSKLKFFNESLSWNSSSYANLPLLKTDKSFIPPNMKEGHYGKIKKIEKPSNETLNIFPENQIVEPPPVPPRPNIYPLPKSDSKKSEIQQIKSEEQPEDEKLKNSEFSENEQCNTSTSIDKSKPLEIIQWSSLKRVAKKMANNIEHKTNHLLLTGKKSSKLIDNDESVERKKSICNTGDIHPLPFNFPKHSGIMYRPGGVERWGVLSQRKLTLFANKDSPDIKETISMDNIISVQVTQNKISETFGVHCFEISLSSKNQLLLFGVPSISERHIWMRKLLESIGPGFSAKLSMDYSKAGYCYAKENISCEWTKRCILLHHRTLYLSSEYSSVSEFNLRKARSISFRTEGFNCAEATEKGPQIVIDLQDKTLYLQMDYERETLAWEAALMEAALQNGPSLNEQQLTKDNVPAIVDKCLNFVHTHGCFSEGIYRRSGSNRTVNHLLAMFRYNAWSVQLSKDDCTEFDVSSVLKRFFRDLPEPVLTSDIQEELGKIIAIKDINEKTKQYELTLKKLPDVNYLTARRLMGHLYFIDKQKEKNLMGSENLAAIWGPNILQVQEQVSLDSNCFKIETLVVNDLIRYYPEIFSVNETEIEKEMKILQMLEIYHASNNNTLSKKPSGEIKIWVYLHSANNADNCYNISVNPQKTAEDVCKELSCKANEPPHTLCLEEVICNGHLNRPLNHSEKVLDTILRWSYWDENDRRDNCLVLKKNDLFQQVVQYAKFPVIVSEELKFADNKSKTFKSCQFEFSQAKLNCYKDKLCSQKLGEWKVEDIIWYFGHEPKRIPHAKWSITFIEKNSIGPRTKEKPYFGNTICGLNEEQKLKLTTAMLMAQYSKNILPKFNLME